MNRKLLSEFKEALRLQGLGPAMRLLNDATGYRFSAVYTFLGADLRNICLIDKMDARVSCANDIPVEESYCVFIKRYGLSFSVENSLEDSRVENHPKQQIIHSYYGVPILDPTTGRIIGTVCHFDYDSMKLSGDTVDILDCVVPLIAEALTSLLTKAKSTAV